MYAKCKKCGSLISPYGEQICKCELMPTQKVPVKKGVEYDCLMFEVRCKQECVSGGLRRTDKCPYDNYNSKTGIKPKGAKTMAKNSNKPAANGGQQSSLFQPTFRKYEDMNDGEKAAFKQGCKTSENKVKERLGFVKPKQ